MRDEGAAGRLQIAIDGPAASGKSTVALGIARRIGLLLVDSGSMYRTVALISMEEGISADDREALVEIARRVSSSFRLELAEGDTLRVYLGERDVTAEIRSPEVGRSVSPVSEEPGVRAEMVRLQRCLVEGRDAVVEGRDIGTTVLPDAPLKVFLEATSPERTRRRALELEARGVDVDRDQVREEIALRDRIDSSRAVSPLRPAADAVPIDTTDKTAADVIDEIVGLLADKGLIH